VINVEQIISNKYPSFTERPASIKHPTLLGLRHLVREQQVNHFLNKNQHYQLFEFINQVLDYFDVSYSLSNTDRMNIPSNGRVLIVANHPPDALDGLALLKMIGEICKDVKSIANDMLANIIQLKPLLLPVDNLN